MNKVTITTPGIDLAKEIEQFEAKYRFVKKFEGKNVRLHEAKMLFYPDRRTGKTTRSVDNILITLLKNKDFSSASHIGRDQDWAGQVLRRRIDFIFCEEGISRRKFDQSQVAFSKWEISFTRASEIIQQLMVTGKSILTLSENYLEEKQGLWKVLGYLLSHEHDLRFIIEDLVVGENELIFWEYCLTQKRQNLYERIVEMTQTPLKVWWNPNFVGNFEIKVSNLFEAMVATDLLTQLDLTYNQEAREKTIEKYGLEPSNKIVEAVSILYCKFRQKYSMNSFELIEMNVGGLEILNDQGEWEEWMEEENGYDFKEYMDSLELNETILSQLKTKTVA